MPKVFKKDQNADYQYSSWLNAMLQLVEPKNQITVLGRGTGKTTDILSGRLESAIYDMPSAYFAFASDTYTHALADMVPTLLDGLNKKGILFGRDYVTDKRPPDHFNLPYKQPLSYKHTISFRNGCFLKIVSLDEPSSMAGASYQHLFADEAKYLDFQILKKLIPAIRGEYLTFSKSPLYRGISLTTDMPNIADKGEFDWFMDYESQMNHDQIKLIFAAGLTLNKHRIEYSRAFAKQNEQRMKVAMKKIERWEQRWVNIRKNSTIFTVASSLVNAELLTVDYFIDSLNSLGWEEFKSSVFSLKPELKAGEKFYVNIGAHHFYDDGVKNEFYENHILTDQLNPTSEALRYINQKEPIEGGLDFGNMISLVTAQVNKGYLYVLKGFYTLPPENEKYLGKKFRKFFRNHRNKRLILYYDRSGNNLKKMNKDWATDVKNAIEYDEFGGKTDWTVELMSEGQGNISQADEYRFMQKFFSESVPGLPKPRIDKYNCKCLKSSLGIAKVIFKKNSKGQTEIKKDKTSESLPFDRLPEWSTNFSDAFKYLVMRPKWVRIAFKSRETKFSDPDVV